MNPLSKLVILCIFLFTISCTKGMNIVKTSENSMIRKNAFIETGIKKTRIIDVTEIFEPHYFSLIKDYLLSNGDGCPPLGNAPMITLHATIGCYDVWVVNMDVVIPVENKTRDPNSFDTIVIRDSDDALENQYYYLVYFHPSKDIEHVKKTAFGGNSMKWNYKEYKKGHLYLMVNYCDAAIPNDLIIDNFKTYIYEILSFIGH